MQLPSEKAVKLANVQGAITSIEDTLHSIKVHAGFAARARKYQSFKCDFYVNKILAALVKLEDNQY